MLSYLGVDNKGLPTDWFLVTVLVRDAVVVALCVLVVRTMLRPERDLVRATVGDDPDWPATDGRTIRVEDLPTVGTGERLAVRVPHGKRGSPSRAGQRSEARHPSERGVG
jgi:hypothetical protein